MAADRDQPLLRNAMAQLIAKGQSRVQFGRPDEIPAGWIDASKAGTCVAAAATTCSVAGGWTKGRAGCVAQRTGARAIHGRRNASARHLGGLRCRCDRNDATL